MENGGVTRKATCKLKDKFAFGSVGGGALELYVLTMDWAGGEGEREREKGGDGGFKFTCKCDDGATSYATSASAPRSGSALFGSRANTSASCCMIQMHRNSTVSS